LTERYSCGIIDLMNFLVSSSLKLLALTIVVILMLFFGISVTGASDTQTPQVVTSTPTDLSELPRTGIPLAAWALGALAPIGLKFLKNDRKTEINESSPNSIWHNRQMDK
jgi:hypothetical protein